MLAKVGVADLDELIDRTVPHDVRQREPMELPTLGPRLTDYDELLEMARSNRLAVSMIGMGYHQTITPAVIRRNVFENPGWYTAYTPYQPEISQGRLEALLNFQTMVSELTAMDLANASLLDEATAAAEAMTLLHRVSRGRQGDRFAVDEACHPQTIAVVEARAEPIGLEVVVCDPVSADLEGVFGLLVQYPGTTGAIPDLRSLIERSHGSDTLVAVAADPLALCVLTPPGEMGADVVVGSTQRFGVPMSFGGPHAAYIAVREAYQRALPGRLVGVSRDSAGRQALRLALQTREQHIRREKATSNICTSQVLLAVMASMYAIHHGPEGLSRIALRVNRVAAILAHGLRENGIEIVHDQFFDTVCIRVPGRADKVIAVALANGVNLRRVDADTVAASVDERTTPADLEAVWKAFGYRADFRILDRIVDDPRPVEYRRTTPVLSHPIFSAFRSETELVRYMRRLVNRDIALDRSMIPLGSCTMKLNAATEMEPVSWPELANIHPFAPLEQTVGYQRLIDQLEHWLAEITGFAAVSLQPNSGAQGELAGLLAIRAYHRSRGDTGRDVCLIPSSAHGTNAASAVMAGMRVMVVDCDDMGNVDVDDLKRKAVDHSDALAALMITYPSTHGVFETAVRHICEVVHEHGGQVYLDGANLNAMVGLGPARPVRCRCQPHQPAQDVLHPPRRRGSRGRAHRRGRAPDPVHAQPPVGPGRGAADRARSDRGCTLGLGGHPGHPVDVHPHDGLRGSAEGHRDRHPQRQLRGGPVERCLSDPLHRLGGVRGPRVHHRHPGAPRHLRHHGRRHRQAVDRLRLPCPDHELPGGGDADDRAHRVGGQSRAGPVLRRDAGHRRGGPAGWPGRVAPG